MSGVSLFRQGCDGAFTGICAPIRWLRVICGGEAEMQDSDDQFCTVDFELSLRGVGGYQSMYRGPLLVVRGHGARWDEMGPDLPSKRRAGWKYLAEKGAT